MATQFFVVRAVGKIMSGWSVGKIIIISFRVGTFKNKNIDYGVKNTGAIMLAQVTYKIDHVSLLQDSTISSALNFKFFYAFCCNLEEKGQITRNINSKRINVYIGNQYFYYFGLPKFRVGQARTEKH